MAPDEGVNERNAPATIFLTAAYDLLTMCFGGVQMSNEVRNVQKLDVQQLDIVKGAVAKGLHRLVVRTRKIRANLWTGSVSAEETVTTVEPSDARH